MLLLYSVIFYLFMETKEYYHSFMTVIKYLMAGHNEISREKGEELSGEYWTRIFKVLQNEHVGIGLNGGYFCVTQAQYLNLLYADCVNAIEEIEKREADRKLDNDMKKSNMKYARKAYWISIAALVVAAASLVCQIFT